MPVSNITDELLASQFKVVCSALNDFFDAVLDDDTVVIDGNQYELFLKSFQHYNRFVEAGSMPFFSRISQHVNDYVLNYLRMHFTWLVKWMKKLTAEFNLESIK